MPDSIISPTIRYTFPKVEKLCGDKLIEQLFLRGTSFIKYPLRVTYLVRQVPQEGPEAGTCQPVCRMMVSVGKKRFKRAVKRNRVKRQVREAYRLRKAPLFDAVGSLLPGNQLLVAYVFIGKELPETLAVEKAVGASVDKLLEAVKADANKE